MRFSAVLFDMDGVVADTMPLHRAVWRQFAAAHGIERSDDELRATDGRRASEIIEMLFGDLDAERVHALAEAREALYREELRTARLEAVAGVRELIRRLAELGIPRVIATSATPENVSQVLRPLGLHGSFDATVTSADVKRGKPDPEVYLTAAARAGVAPSACLVIEDALPGIEAARAAGAACLGVTTSLPAARLLGAGASWAVETLHPEEVEGAIGPLWSR